jgi:ABC-2 type transport system ATP-binding protein
MSDLAIELHGVGKHYPFFRLDRIDLQVPHGQIMGLIGPNGAGKSTTIRILMGLVQQDCGEVRVLGRRMPAEQIAAKWDIGFASEDMRLYEGMTLAWHMNFIRSIYPNWDAPYAQLLLKRFGLRAVQTIKGLSHGQRVKATLLLVLARRPRLLVLDEPTTGLDPVARHEILKELTAVMTDEGRSVLFSSHNHTGRGTDLRPDHVYRPRPHHRLHGQGSLPGPVASLASGSAVRNGAAGSARHHRNPPGRTAGRRHRQRLRARDGQRL